MQVIKGESKDDERIQKEIESSEKLEKEAYTLFRKSLVYPYIVKSIEDKIQDVTDTRKLAQSFGRIKNEVISELGILGIASLMAAEALEVLLEEIVDDSE
jgi:hypothetical protein